MAHCKGWSQEDVDYLEAHFGKCHVSKIAKHLERTEKAVVGKARKLGLNIQTAGGYITREDLVRSFKTNRHVVNSWFEKGLKCRNLKIVKKNYYFIDIADFWKWAKDNIELIDFSNLERNVLIPEPKWLDEACKNSYKTAVKRNFKPWSNVEEQYLVSRRKQGDSFRDIATELERTQRAVVARYAKLVERGLAQRKRHLIYWTEKEVEMFLVMDKQGLQDKEIAEELGRETTDIKYKRKHLRMQGLYQGRKKRSSR